MIIWPITLGYQSGATQIELKDIELSENPPIIGRYFAYQYQTSDKINAVLYWFETTAFTVNSTTQQKQVKISVIASQNPVESMPEIENELVTIAEAIAQHWQPLKTWTQAALLISKNLDKLAAVTASLLIFVVIIFGLQRRKERGTNAKVYQKLSKSNKEMVDVVHETEMTTLPTLNNIATYYRNGNGKAIDKEELLQKLMELEKTSVIKKEIASKDDEPILIWKTTMSFAEPRKT